MIVQLDVPDSIVKYIEGVGLDIKARLYSGLLNELNGINQATRVEPSAEAVSDADILKAKVDNWDEKFYRR